MPFYVEREQLAYLNKSEIVNFVVFCNEVDGLASKASSSVKQTSMIQRLPSLA